MLLPAPGFLYQVRQQVMTFLLAHLDLTLRQTTVWHREVFDSLCVDGEPVEPSSIFESLETVALGSPTTSPSNIAAICAAVNFIYLVLTASVIQLKTGVDESFANKSSSFFKRHKNIKI
jgi:hypothetical protein